MKIHSTFILIIICTTNIVAKPIENKTKNKPESFSYLSKVELPKPEFSSSSYNPKVFYNPEYTEVVDLPVDSSHILYDENITDLIQPHEFIITQINKDSKDKYHIHFSYGLSYDPYYMIYKQSKDTLIHLFGIPGFDLFIPGNGNIYVGGHTNNYFYERRKFKFANDTISEIIQPFKYVGLETKTNKTLKIFSTKELTEIVAVLPPKSQIEVLINEGNHFLIKTSFGLVGWWEFDGYSSDTIKEIYFNGD